MKRTKTMLLFILLFKMLNAQETLELKEIVYGHMEGVALVMNVVKPSAANGIAVVRLISSGWKSFVPDSAYIKRIKAFTEKGQTVFLVSHASQPRYKISEILEQIKLAVRFIRYNAKQFGIDPDRIGITGISSGAHLSLMIAFSESTRSTFQMNDNAKPKISAVDKSVDLELFKVGAVGCFSAPSDLVEFGCPDSNIFHSRVGRDIASNAFYVTIKNTTAEQNRELKILSPIYHISDKTPPVILFHGDNDRLVPIKQSKNLIDSLEKYNIPCKLIVIKGAGHTWETMNEDNELIAVWFEKYLPEKN